MSTSMYRSQMSKKRDQRVNAEKRASEHRKKESEKRTAAAKARSAAALTKSNSARSSRLREADSYENDANSAGKVVAAWQVKAANYLKEEARIGKQLASAEASEAKVLELKRKREIDRATRDDHQFRRGIEHRLVQSETAISALREPKSEKLRILILGASGEGDLRIGREVKRIQDAVRAANLRDLVELDVRPAATPNDLLDGLTGFRPHVVHFSGHSNEALILFEEDVDVKNVGAVVSADVFARALSSVDDPPLLVVLNSCSSAPQAEKLVAGSVSFAIGMSDSVDDRDAINYAARFYAAIADGQSVGSANQIARTQLELMGTPGFDIPILVSADGTDAYAAKLVLPPA